MKFVMTTACYSPFEPIAGEAHVKYLSRGLVSRGHEVHIFYSWDANRYKKYDVSHDPPQTRRDEDGVFLHPVRSPLGAADPYLGYLVGNSPYVERAFRNLVAELKPDVVHHHNIFFLGHKILRKRSDYLCLYTPHDFWLVCTRNDLLRNGRFPCDSKSCFICGLYSIASKRPPQLWRWGRGYHRSLRGIDIILAHSQSTKHIISQELENRVEYIPLFAISQSNIETSGYSNYFLYAGMLVARKGILSLLEVFRRYRKEIKANLIIVGRGFLEGQIKEFIRQHDLQEKVILLGWVSDSKLWALYKDAAALVVPSLSPETGPVVALEALSVGTPIIGSDQGGLPEIIGKVDEGLVFPAGDTERMAAKLAGFDRGKYPPEALKQIYRENYSLEAYLEGYERVIALG
jgi:glycosyltransferase involved in cell wall biosynthesis